MVKMWSIDCIRIFRLLIHKKHVYMFDVYLVWCRKSWVFLGIPRHQCGSATDEDSCGLCSQSRETIDHLLISCPFSREVWFNLLRKFGLGCSGSKCPSSYAGRVVGSCEGHSKKKKAEMLRHLGGADLLDALEGEK